VEPDLSNAELRGVARRPATGSLRNFLSDLKSLLNVRTLKATVQEFQRDDALGLAAQLAYYLILALFPFILVLVSLMGLVGSPELANTVLGYFRQVTPTEVYTLINEYTGDIISGQARAPGLLSALMTLRNSSTVIAGNDSPPLNLGATCPASISLSPMTSWYGTFCSWASRILKPSFSFLASSSALMPSALSFA